MKNLIIISLSVSLLFGLIACKATAQVTTAQLPAQPTTDKVQAETQSKAPQRRQKRTYEPKVPGGEVNWMSFKAAQKAMKKEPKKVFVKVYAEWCGWCKRLDQATFADKRVADYINENYYPVKFDAQHPDCIKLGDEKYTNPEFDKSKPIKARNATHQLAQKYGARSYPTILFLDEKMDLIQAIPGYRDADAFMPILERFNQKNVTTQTKQPNTDSLTNRTAQREALADILHNPPQNRQQRTYEPKIPGGKVNWMSFEEVEKAMKEKPKKVFVSVYTQWCGWCRRLDQATFTDKRVAEYINENYYPVKFDAQHPDPVKIGDKEYTNPRFDASRPAKARNATHQLAQKYGARAFPTILFIDEKMDLIQAIPGYRDADAFMPILEQFN